MAKNLWFVTWLTLAVFSFRAIGHGLTISSWHQLIGGGIGLAITLIWWIIWIRRS